MSLVWLIKCFARRSPINQSIHLFFLFENGKEKKELIWLKAFGGPKAMNEWRNEMDERFHLPRQHFQLFFSFGLGLWACCGLVAAAAALLRNKGSEPTQTNQREGRDRPNQSTPFNEKKRNFYFQLNWWVDLIDWRERMGSLTLLCGGL